MMEIPLNSKGRVILVDTENLGKDALASCRRLGRKDEFVLFHTRNSPNPPYEDIEALLRCKAKVTFVNCSVTHKQSLDMALSTWLGAHAKAIARRGKIAVVLSGDKGFLSARQQCMHLAHLEVYVFDPRGKQVQGQSKSDN